MPLLGRKASVIQRLVITAVTAVALATGSLASAAALASAEPPAGFHSTLVIGRLGQGEGGIHGRLPVSMLGLSSHPGYLSVAATPSTIHVVAFREGRFPKRRLDFPLP